MLLRGQKGFHHEPHHRDGRQAGSAADRRAAPRGHRRTDRPGPGWLVRRGPGHGQRQGGLRRRDPPER